MRLLQRCLQWPFRVVQQSETAAATSQKPGLIIASQKNSVFKSSFKLAEDPQVVALIPFIWRTAMAVKHFLLQKTNTCKPSL
jgi:hypothetical protein